jgi:hypothetical protein
MAMVGPLVVEPDVGSYCWITLDSGEQILISHDTENTRTGCIAIEVPNAFAFGSEPIFSCDLDSPGGRAAMAKATYRVRSSRAARTPLAVFVEYMKDAGSVAVVKFKCDVLDSASSLP